MQTKNLYKEGIWERIVNYPAFDLGHRELEAFIRFLPATSQQYGKIEHILHLGIGNGREVLYVRRNLPNIKSYVINDCCLSTLENVSQFTKRQFPNTHFLYELGDIEQPRIVMTIRNKLFGNTLLLLAGNASIFSNRNMDEYIKQAMRDEDLLLLTVETPHGDMSYSYQIEPVFKFLSQNGSEIQKMNTTIFYDHVDQCLKISHNGNVIFVSYKPTAEQLRKRMTGSGFSEVALQEYPDLHMIGSLWKKE